MKILVTGANGFIARNLLKYLEGEGDFSVVTFTHDDSTHDLLSLVRDVDVVVHLAGVNRPEFDNEFVIGNVGFTEMLCSALTKTGRRIPIIFSSSVQASRDNPYGKSKMESERILSAYSEEADAEVFIYRLQNVFGKWCKPNYNSAVATFCHNIARDLPITVNDPNAKLTLVYIDDVVGEFVRALKGMPRRSEGKICKVMPEYVTTVGSVANYLKDFRESRNTLITQSVGSGLLRALYSTYISHLPLESSRYCVPRFGDERGVFVEMLKTHDSGQFSYFTAHPGVTRGGHYHHTKTEKFLVIKGLARFGFRHILTDERFVLETEGGKPEIVETIPGWAHDITNIGTEEMIVMLWANEVFNRDKPDTYQHEV